MFVGQVAVGLANQDAAVFVIHPLGGCHVVDAGHHAIADEVVSSIVEADGETGALFAFTPQPDVFASQHEGFPKTARRLSFAPALRGDKQPLVR